MGAVELAGAVPDPEEVGGRVVPAFGVVDGVAGAAFALVAVEETWKWGRGAGGRVTEVAREALLVFEEEAFVAGVKIDGFEAAGGAIGSNGAHELEGFGDAVNDASVLSFDAFVFDVTEFPV